MSKENIPCDIDEEQFPPFHAFIATPELYYCYLQFVYYYNISGGILPDGETIIFNRENKLSVPIDNDTVYLSGGEIKAKQTDGKPTNIVSRDPRTTVSGSGFERIIDTSGILGPSPTNLISLDTRTTIGGSGYSRTIDTSGITGGIATNITSDDPRTVIGGSGYNRSIDTSAIVNTDTATSLSSLDSRTVIGGSGFYKTIDTSNIVNTDTPTNLTSDDPRTVITGSGFDLKIDTTAITGGGSTYTSSGLNIDNTNDTIEFKNPALSSEQIAIEGDIRLNTWITSVNNNLSDIETALNDMLVDVGISSSDNTANIIKTSNPDKTIDFDITVPDSSRPTSLTSDDPRTVITGSGFDLNIDTTAISGGSTYSSSDLNIDNTNETINFNTPYALDAEQVLIKDDVSLMGFIVELSTILQNMQTDIDSKVKTVDVTTNTPEIVTITKTENNKNISFELDVGTIPTKDLTELVFNDNVKTITFEDASKISTAYIISFVGSAVGQLEFYDSGSISLINDGGNNLLMTNNLANPDITTTEFTWVQATKTITFLNSAIVNTNDLIDVGVGEYTIKQNMGLQDVNIGSADNTAVITKSMANDMIDFDLAIPDQSKPTTLSSEDARTTIGGSGFDLTIDTSGIVDTDTATTLTSLDPRTPVTGSGFNLEIDTSAIADYGLFLSDVELSDDIRQYEAIAVEDLHAKNLNMKLSTGSMIYDSEGRLGYITGWDNVEETIARVYTIVTEMPTGFIKTLELGSGGDTVSPDGDGNAVIPYADAGNDDGIVKGESDTVTINDGLVNVKLPLPTPTEATANYVLAINPTGTGYELVPAGEEGKEINIDSPENTLSVSKTSTSTDINFEIDVRKEEPGITDDIWVDSVNGDDANNGLTSETPFKTFERAIEYVESERYSTNLLYIHLIANSTDQQSYEYNITRNLFLYDIIITGTDPNYRPVLTCNNVVILNNSRNVTFEHIHFQQPNNNPYTIGVIISILNSIKIQVVHCSLNVLSSATAMSNSDLIGYENSSGLLRGNNYWFNNTVSNCAIFRVSGDGIVTIEGEDGNTRNGLTYICHNQYGVFSAPQNIGGEIAPTFRRNSIGYYFA